MNIPEQTIQPAPLDARDADKASYWQQVMDEWERSDLNQQAFCESKSISFARFGYWRGRLKRGKKQPTQQMVPLKVMGANTPPSQCIQIKLPTGIQISIPDGCSEQSMQSILKLVGLQSC